MHSPLHEYHSLVDSNPASFCEDIRKMVGIQKDMLSIYDFIESKGKTVVDWIERFCILPEGEHAGEPVRLMLWQKWLIYSVFCFWGHFNEPEHDAAGNVIGTTQKYLRVVNDILMVIASGNSKTTLMGFLNAYLLYSKDYPAAKIYIGSNAQHQSLLCYNATHEIIRKAKALKRYARLVPSLHLIEIQQNNSLLMAMSSDGKNYEGIIPTNIMIDEIHEMKTSTYADNLRKSVKRDDSFVFETTTMGTVRGGYMDGRLEYAKKILDREVINHRFFCCIFRQDSEEEIFKAYERDDMAALMKSNPGMGQAVSTTLLRNKIKEMLDDPTKRTINLTKNFNIPQNPINCYFSERECRAKPFDEDIFQGAPVFFGLDMAYTRSPENDLACLSLMTKNPLSEEEYFRDFYFLPKYWERQRKENGEITIDRLDMIAEKSKYDTNIIFDAKKQRYGYQMYADRGDVIIIDEALINILVEIYGEDAYSDCTGVTQQFILYFLAYIEKLYYFRVCKFGLDPNKAGEIESFVNANIGSIDGLPPAIKFQMEKSSLSNPIIEATKDIRARGLVYCNNKLTELHFANAQYKEKADGGIVLINSQRARKDGVIAHLAARSAYNVFVNNSKTGAQNKQLLVEWWSAKNASMGA